MKFPYSGGFRSLKQEVIYRSLSPFNSKPIFLLLKQFLLQGKYAEFAIKDPCLYSVQMKVQMAITGLL